MCPDCTTINPSLQRIDSSPHTPFVSSSGQLSAPSPAPVIGIIGGVGSGKSAVARGLQRRCHVGLIDADQLGHQALEDRSIQRRIRETFGNHVFKAEDQIDRSLLARQVFGPEQEFQQRRELLEKIVHPWINQRIKEEIEQHRESGCLAVLLDAAVLLESGWSDACHAIVFIDASREQRERQVLAQRNWTPEQLAAREASQLPLEVKRSRSDAVVDNSHTLESAIDQLEEYLQKLLGRTCLRRTSRLPD